MIDLRQKLLEAFDTEHRIILQNLRALLQKWEDQGDGKISKDDLNDTLRFAHTLKGASRIVDLLPLVELSHRIENFFGKYKDPELTLNTKELSKIQKIYNGIEDYVSFALKGSGQNSDSVMQEMISLLEEDLLAESSPPPTATASPLVSETAEKSILQAQKEKPVATKIHSMGTGETLRLKAEVLDRLLRTSAELSALNSNAELGMEVLPRALKRLEGIQSEWELIRNTSFKHIQRSKGDRNLQQIHHFFEGLEKEIKGVFRDIESHLKEGRQKFWHLRSLNERMKKEAQDARMIPAISVFEGFSKMIRDVAAKEGKEVDFRLSGMEVEVDRLVLQALKDPLMHILQNAVAHGIEFPSLRPAAGKKPQAKIDFRMETGNQQVKLIVTDDGQGINWDKVTEKAIMLKYCTRDEAKKLDPHILQKFIFSPGFSTAEKVTDISGRGIGLSVVADAIKKLRGEITVESKTGQGTTFIVTVPTVMIGNRLLLVGLEEQRFAFLTQDVESIKRIKWDEIQMVEGRPVYFWQGQHLPIFTLSSLLGLSEKGRDGHSLALIVRIGQELSCFLVDQVYGERESMIQNMNPLLAGYEQYSGTIILEDGNLALVLKVEKLVEKFDRSVTLEIGKKMEDIKESKGKHRILVVDDSITTRTIEKSILEAQGHDVELAMDGLEALECLRTKEFDLVISDFEMPRMDGITLVQEVRKDPNPQLAKIPILLVTSRDDPKDREMGLAVGASAYIVKQKFDQATLLEAIDQIL